MLHTSYRYAAVIHNIEKSSSTSNQQQQLQLLRKKNNRMERHQQQQEQRCCYTYRFSNSKISQLCMIALLIVNMIIGVSVVKEQIKAIHDVTMDVVKTATGITTTSDGVENDVTRQLGVEDQTITTGTTTSPIGDTESEQSRSSNDRLLVRYGDQIYTKNDWDGAPIVIEQYKLLFFTSAKVGCTTWKQLFRRMMGLEDYHEEDNAQMLPWNPELNGLSYLYHYNRTMANYMMTSPEWTRAIFVRDPKERFLSAYLDKVIYHNGYIRKKCCPYRGICAERAKQSIETFLQIVYICSDAHWNPQSNRFYKYRYQFSDGQQEQEDEYWSVINFVGHMESVVDDSKRLLQHIGAWDEYGKDGWGPNNDRAIFQSESGSTGRQHATDANQKLQQYISPELEVLLEEFYESDYNNPVFNLTLNKIQRTNSTTTAIAS